MQTAHNLWNLLRARYNSIEAGQLLKNFVHDKDLEMVIEKLYKGIDDSIDMYIRSVIEIY